MEIRSNSTKAFTMIELMVVVTMLGVLAGIASGMYLTYMSRAKTAEAVQALGKMVEGEMAYFQKSGNFIEAGPVNIPPSKLKVTADFSADPRWKDINFEYRGLIYFGYQAVSPSADIIDCEALGDLDGDGTTSTFRRTIDASSGHAVAGGVAIFDELE